MLPGVELARRRRVHYHGDGAAGGGRVWGAPPRALQLLPPAAPPSGGGERGGGGGRRGRAWLKIDKTTGERSDLVFINQTTNYGWGRRFRERDGSTTSRQQNNQQEQQIQLPTEPRPTPKHSMTMLEAPSTRKAPRREMRRTLSKADLCAVCLDEVRERHQRVTRLPCSHKYHSECVLPWLAIQPDCPCCRTQVPSVDSLFVA
ncbi:hypothetical protein OsJ_34382 [Oryza sativa Japonica Group]|uniref:RING-type domain-containing protein n=1 Tax=Oryza sativa subsp. japonica TaxID=39947 RepID=B9G878_ORYSJ|nr:hypothetical protein OsJ_34382 [Oryza sativa Japonica Group]